MSYDGKKKHTNSIPKPYLTSNDCYILINDVDFMNHYSVSF